MYMMASSSSAAISITGGAQFKSRKLHYYNLGALGGNQSQVYPLKLNRFKPRQSFSIRAEYSDGPKNGGSDFVAGFLLGGAVFGTLAYVFAPKKTRQTLNEKISQLNSAIDNVSSRLRGGTGSMSTAEDDEADSEVEASM